LVDWKAHGSAFRGAPHVHVWIHVADHAAVKLNS
jgi:hypothetical protein